MKRMLDKLFILWMLQKIFHAFVGPLQLLMCASWLYVKLKLLMDMAFLTHLWNSLNTLGSILERYGSLDPFTMFQRPMDANNILIFYFQSLNFPSFNLLMILVILISNDSSYTHIDICPKHSNKISFTSNVFYYQIIRTIFSYTSIEFENHSNHK